ncbi:MAG: hypothetical protein ACO1TE_00395 [Prosthecobacter sp.]
MNTEDPLDRVLCTWHARADTPPDFREEIWRRIAVENPPSRASRVAWWVLQPKRAFLMAAAVVAVAAAWGLTHPAGSEVSPHDAYVISVSPFDPHTLQPLRP